MKNTIIRIATLLMAVVFLQACCKKEAPEVVATAVNVTPESSVLKVGETLQLTAKILPVTSTDKEVIWSSSDESIAKVVEGKVTAVKPGTVTISAKVNNRNVVGKATITVVQDATGLTLSVTEHAMKVGEEFTIEATIIPDDATDKTITWTSSDESVATVKDGVVTALQNGTTTITAKTSNGHEATVAITVTTEASGIALNETAKLLKVGETFTFVATIDPESASDKTVTWTSSDESVATVKEGVVTALKNGETTISAKTSNGLEATAIVTVVTDASGISLNVSEKAMKVGETFTFVATIQPESTSDKTVTWTSSDESVATVKDGVVTALQNGTTTITAKTSNGLEATATVTVTTDATGITLNVSSQELKVGETFTLVATITPETTSDKTITWASSDSSIIQVVDGVVTALKAGEAEVTATTVNGLKASATFVVKSAEPVIPDVPGEEL